MGGSREDENYALRINQLDSTELDTELNSLLLTQLKKIFKYMKPGFITQYEPELRALLRFITWRYSLVLFGSTLGQQLLDISYTGAKGKSVSYIRKLVYAVLVIGTHWFSDRSADLKMKTVHYKYHHIIWKIVKVVDSFVKMASIVNFLVFLQHGCYQLLIERLLSIRAVFPRKQYVRQLSYEYMNRELLWHGFSEFLMFVLPLINFRKIKNMLQRNFLPNYVKKREGKLKHLKECVICGEWPLGPQEIGCDHVFCYYCIYSNVEADDKYSCPVCGQKADQIKNLHIKLTPNKQS